VAAVQAGLVSAREGPVAVVVTGANIDAAILGRLLAARV
jgi:hypothetical protein